MATAPVQKLYRKAYQDFRGGLDSRPNPLLIPADRFAQLDNAVLNDVDLLQKVQGYTLDGSPFPNNADSFIRMLVNYRKGTTVNTLVCAAQDNGNTHATYKVDLKQSSGDGTYSYIGYTVGTATFTNGSASVVGQGTPAWLSYLKAGDQIKPNAYSNWYVIQSVDSNTGITLTANYTDTTVTAGAYRARIVLDKDYIPVGLVFNDALLISNGKDVPLNFDNTDVKKLQSANAPTAKFLEAHKNRVFAASTPGQPSGLYWSYVNDALTWDSTSFVGVYPQDNGEIVAIKSFADSLIVFKDNGKVYQVIGSFDQDAFGAPAAIRRIDVPDNVGVIAGRTVVLNDDNKLYFLSETGIYTIDPRMYVTKVSWEITPLVTGLVLKSTRTSTKTFTYNSKATWETGAQSATNTVRNTNKLSTYYDRFAITDAKQQDNSCAVVIDSNNDVHVAYVVSTGGSVKYTKYLASDNTSTTQTVATTSGGQLVDCLSMAVSSTGLVGILWKQKDASGSYALYKFSELSSGVWTTTQVYSTQANQGIYASTSTYIAAAKGISVKYTGTDVIASIGQGNVIDIVGPPQRFDGRGNIHIYRTSGTWGTINITLSDFYSEFCTIFKSANGNYHHLSIDGASIKYFISTNSGSTWTNTKTINVSGATSIGAGFLSLGENDKNEIIITYCLTNGPSGDTGKIARYNMTLDTTTYPASTATTYLRGHRINGNKDFFYIKNSSGYEGYVYDMTYEVATATLTNANTAVTGQTTHWNSWLTAGDKIKAAAHGEDKYTQIATVGGDTSLTLVAGGYLGATATTAAYVAKSTRSPVYSSSGSLSSSWRSSDSGLDNQGNLVASCAFGANVNEIIVTRITLFGQWTGPAESDSTLSAWGVVSEGGLSVGNNSSILELALSTGTPTDYTPILSGSIISTNANLNHARAKISFILGGFNATTIDSLILNYTGAGVDAKLPTGFVFNNEMYTAVTQSGQAGNNLCIFLDRMGAWGNNGYAVSCFTKYNNQLYGGSSTNGSVYKLRQSYAFNGAAYTATAVFKEDLLGSLELDKEIYKIYVLYQNQTAGTFNFDYRLDNLLNPAGASWNSTTIDQTQNGLAEIAVGNTAKSIQCRVTNAEAGVNIGIIGFIVIYGYLGLR